MKKFYILALIVTITGLLFTSAASAQATDDYRTVATGNWNSLATWERYNGTTWQALTGVAPLTLPTSGDGVITIQNGHTVTVTANVTVDQVTIAAGGQVTVNNVTLTVNDGTGTDLTVNGILEVTGTTGGTVASTGGPSFIYNSGSTYRHSRNGGSIAFATGGGSITTWDINSTIEFSSGGTLSASTTNGSVGRILVSNNSNATITGGTLTVSNSTGDDLSIASGSSLTIGTGAGITLANSAGIAAAIDGTLTINNGRTFNLGTAASVTTVTGTVSNAGTISNATAAKLSFSGGSTYQHAQNGGSIPTATWAATSTCRITGITSTLPASASLNQTFGNFTWNCTGQTVWPSGNIAPTTMQVAGNLTVEATGAAGNLRDFAINQATALAIGGDLIVTGGRFTVCYTTTNNLTRTINVSGNVQVSGGELTIIASTATNNTGVLTVYGNITISGGTLNLSNSAQLGVIYANGNYTHSGGTVTETGTNTASAIHFTGNGTPQTYTSGGTVAEVVNFVVNPGAYLQMADASTVVGGAGSFTLSSDAALGITSTAGITSSGATGNIQATGTRSYNTGASYIYNGAGGAQVTGNGLPATVANLTINNAAGVTLSQAATVSGVATFTSGVLTTTTPNLLTIGDAGSVSGASDASFVDGPVAKAGTTAFSFPVGKTGVGHMQIDIAGLTNADAATTFTAQYFRASAKTAFPGQVAGLVGMGIQGVSNCEYWTLDRTDAGNDATASITMYWNSKSPCNGATYVANPPIGLRIVHYNTTINEWDLNGGLVNGGSTGTAGSITWSNVSSFSPFALGALFGSNSSLPVMYDNVKAYAKGTGVQVEWSNLTERELIKYDVQRSLNGTDFTSISTHLPKSNRNDKADYTDFDAAPAQGTNYYRIKAYEVGGKIVYSKILRVEIGGSTQARFSVYPNPVTGSQVTLGLNNLKQGKYTVRVVNAGGQDIHKQMINIQGNSMTQTLQLPASAKSGMYTILISGDNFKESKIFIIK